jgi:hypothetical protein
VPGNGQIRPKTIFATFDGTGAAGDFLPALKIISDAGFVVGIYPADTAVVAGASADVSWFPRVAGSSGIRYDVDNTGDWLEVETTGLIPPAGPNAISFGAHNGGDISVATDGGGGIFLDTGSSAPSGDGAWTVGGELDLTTSGHASVGGKSGIQIIAGSSFPAGGGSGGIEVTNNTADPIIVDSSTDHAGIVFTRGSFPAADPHVVGQAWLNGDVLTISHG